MSNQSKLPKYLDECPLCGKSIRKTESNLERWFNINCEYCGMCRVTTEAIYNKLQQLDQVHKQSLIDKIKELKGTDKCCVIATDQSEGDVNEIYLGVPGFLLVSINYFILNST